MLQKTLLLTYIISTLQICYYGLRAFTPKIVGSDSYFNSFLSNIIEIPGVCFAYLICAEFGRRVSVMVSFLLSFVFCIFSLAFPTNDEYYWGVIAVFLIARIFISAAYVTGELLVYETFPTVIRMQGVALTGTIAYIFSYLGPLIVRLQFHSDSLPLVVFGCLALIAVLCVFILPETISTALPETVEEADMRETGLFRKAVNFRRPAVRVKNTQSVSYHKVNGGFQDDRETEISGQNRCGGAVVVTAVAEPPRQNQQVLSAEFPPVNATDVPHLNQPDGRPARAPNSLVGNDRPQPAVQRSEIERAAASLKRVPKHAKSVHFTVGADGQGRDAIDEIGSKDNASAV